MYCRFCICVGCIVCLCMQSCDKQAQTILRKKNMQRVVNADTIPMAWPEISYHFVAVNRKHLDTPDRGLDIILALNRIDLSNLKRTDSLIVPDSFYADTRVYSPFPPYLVELRQVKKLIFYSYRVQAFGAYENGRLVRWGAVSMGKESTPTPTGLFHTNWRSRKTVSTVDPEWIMEWYFNLENNLGVSMHEYELPGYPASHACVRLSKQDAMWFYDWCQQWKLEKATTIKAYGTPVIVFGTYHFDRKKPWLLLPINKKATMVTETELMQEAARVLPKILERQAARDSLRLES